MPQKIIAKNKKASFEYTLGDRFEAGIVLKGSEIKSVREGKLSLVDSYVEIKNMEAWLMNTHIAPYEPANRFNHDPKRARKLLLHKKEITELWNVVRQKGVTVIPTIAYLKDGQLKVEIALAKGKKLYDKRSDIAKKDLERESERMQKIRY
ncbi:MAG: SsrA-binding protein SmpB [Anaerolineae bacterium]|jgi:SsrA-binding protein|nr:SsrA-binding protein SmpB [Anaerolineae bacterium]